MQMQMGKHIFYSSSSSDILDYMDTLHISSMVKKVRPKKPFLISNTFRIYLFIIFTSVYFLLIFPVLQKAINNSMLEYIRGSKEVTLNYLTPLYGQEVYASEYAISTLANSDVTKKYTDNGDIKIEDPRVIAMQKFLFDYNSPMYPYAKTFITEADKYGLDWRLVASISGVESAFGNIIPKGTHNAWGWRGKNKNADGWSQFATWDEGIAEVTRGLAEGYGTDKTPFQIEQYYCPPCWLNPAHVWSGGVSRYMRELKYYVDNLN